jgi:hypothetical protein
LPRGNPILRCNKDGFLASLLFFINFKDLIMSNTTYAPTYRPQTSPAAELLRELFAATPLGILLAALKSR